MRGARAFYRLRFFEISTCNCSNAWFTNSLGWRVGVIVGDFRPRSGAAGHRFSNSSSWWPPI